MIEALVFDFDGVIIDTETPDFATWQDVFREHGVELDRSLWTELIGWGTGDFDIYGHLENMAGMEVDRDAIRSRKRRLYLARVDSSPLLLGVLDYILAAKQMGLKLGVASSSSRTWVAGHLATRDLSRHFDSVKGSEDVAHVKPDPELYLSSLARLGTRADRSIAIEDSPPGVASAQAAGLFCVAVPNPMTKGLALQHADLILDSLSDLTLGELIEKLDES